MMRRVAVTCAVVVSVLSSSLGGPAEAAATPAFYLPPTAVPTTPGSVIRTEPVALFAQFGPWPGTAQRMLYSSQLQDGSAVAVSGMIIEPSVPWLGQGPRPTIVVGPGTYGQGNQCAASMLAEFPVRLPLDAQPNVRLNYEFANEYLMSSLGLRVIVTDYIGLGTPGIHTYVNRTEMANAVIDAARAGLRLLELPIDSPIGFWGFSEGGTATAAAAELVGSRAPELNVKGTYAGSAAANLLGSFPVVDGGVAMGIIGYVLNGFRARYPGLDAELDPVLNDAGKQFLRDTAGECFGDTLLRHGFRRTEQLTVSGRSLLDHLGELPLLRKALDDQYIGRRTPDAPVMVHIGRNDDVVPEQVDAALAADWCRLGAAVMFSDHVETPPILTGMIVNHVIDYIVGMPTSLGYLIDRFNDVPAPVTCTR
ncbi:lipase family protein [Nocardia brasiliensis]